MARVAGVSMAVSYRERASYTAIVAAAVARFGPFEVKSRIGFGGMGEVFRARYAGTPGRSDIALKLIRPEYASEPRFRQMFLAEARVSALLKHPNIVAMTACGDVDGVLYLASELVDGISLHRLLSAGPLALPLGVHILGAVLDALAYAHDHRDDAGHPLGLVHRDVSPANVLISRGGEVKLADFGVSKVAGAPQTLTGEIKGKPAFMAPEQLPGHGMIDRRADLFAVGVMLHIIALGRPPFSDVASWLALGARLDVSGPLADLITSSLAPDPSYRFASAGELAEALRHAVPAADESAAGELARRVRELAAVERPLTDMERLIMSDLEPSGLIYAPDPSSGQLWAVGPPSRTPTPLAFDDSAPTDTRSYDDVPDMTPTNEFGVRQLVDSLTPMPTPAPLESLTPTPAPLPVALPPPVESLTPTPAPFLPLGSSPLPLDPPPRRRRSSIIVVPALLLVGSVVAVLVASTREREVASLDVPPPVAPPAQTTTLPPPADPSPFPSKPAPPPAAPPPSAPTPPPAEARMPTPSRPKLKSRPPEPAPGYLTLDTEPWAVVYLGARELGTTPFSSVRVPAGRLNLTFDVQRSGRRVRRLVEIAAGTTRRLTLNLR
jgi:serine/threonine-protein kinase